MPQEFVLYHIMISNPNEFNVSVTFEASSIDWLVQQNVSAAQI